jgi:uncharacterized protein (UPF0335 family)
MTDAKLKSLVERIERLMDERDGLGENIRDVFTEVKSAGYVPKVLRKVIVRRRMDPDKRAEEDSWQELYESALSVPMAKAVAMAASGSTAREIESATGISRSAVSRSVPLQNDGGTTVEQGAPNSLRDGGAPVATSTVGPAVTTNSVLAAEVLQDLAERRLRKEEADLMPYADSDGPEDDLAIPSFLRRTA